MMFELTNMTKKIIAVVAIVFTLLLAIEAPSEAVPQSIETPAIHVIASVESAASPEGKSSQEIPSNINDILAQKRVGCGSGSWCCYFPATESYKCVKCPTTPCLQSQQRVCNDAGGQSADDDFCG